MHRIPVFALALFLSTGWWGTVVHAAAAALGLDAPAATPTTKSGASIDPLGAAEQPTPPQTTESAASMDPLG